MRVYLDASILVPMFVADAFSQRAETLLRGAAAEPIVSDFAAAEFASAVNRLVRMGHLTAAEGRLCLTNFDEWTARVAGRVQIAPADIVAASAFLRRLDLNLRTPDAIHIGAAGRLGADLATFDSRMEASANALGARVLAA